jgi:hypothetical protein
MISFDCFRPIRQVKEKNGKFYPQEREFLFWDNFVETDKNVFPTEDVSTVEYLDVFFYTLKEAQDYIDKRKKDLETNKKLIPYSISFEQNEAEMSLTEHLEEVRQRVLW